MMTIPDRTNDVPPPEAPTTRDCKCGKRMIVRLDRGAAHQGKVRWYWWCGCGDKINGGMWHPPTADEHALTVWQRVNDDVHAVAARAAEPVRPMISDCAHENKIVADGGWSCPDCGFRGGTIPPIDDHMRAMPEEWRRRWCDAEGCACEGCASAKGELRFWGFSKEAWEKWVLNNPTEAELMADVEAQPGEDPNAIITAVLQKRPNLVSGNALVAWASELTGKRKVQRIEREHHEALKLAAEESAKHIAEWNAAVRAAQVETTPAA